MPPTLVTYVSGHGFGHISRSLTVLNALRAMTPDVRIILRTAVAPWMVARTAAPGISLEPGPCDTGAVQRDSVHLDVTETLRQAEAFMADWPGHVARETRWLRSVGASLVLADIPPLGIAAASGAGLPSIAFGNFTWDWIYRHWPGGASLADQLGAIYATADLALRLPLSAGFETTPTVVDVPLVARVSQRHPDEVRRLMGWPLQERLVLASFGGFGQQGFDTQALSSLGPGLRIILPLDAVPSAAAIQGSLLALDESVMSSQGLRYEDLVCAVDVVVSKPGYGIIAECAAHNTALVFTSRGDFPEYDVLVSAMPGFIRSAFISHADLFAGVWQPAIEAALASPAPAGTHRLDGAHVVAKMLAERLTG
jgi:L-arabinokinase